METTPSTSEVMMLTLAIGQQVLAEPTTEAAQPIIWEVATSALLQAPTTTLAADEALLSLAACMQERVVDRAIERLVSASAVSPYQTRPWLLEKDVHELLALCSSGSYLVGLASKRVQVARKEWECFLEETLAEETWLKEVVERATV
ncbi:uncharacterized protein A4U43_C02F16370 [Asparagus officinalis]|uniref:Uncharacterized protein n=1 Tax=Asparagus officinalis TaxID=4686 RepID=A0A5P1FNJ9_ASPOF|nr:uncharacterized protein A4U43_C02F16370 [Asparagus officinalis]